MEVLIGLSIAVVGCLLFAVGAKLRRRRLYGERKPELA